MAKDPVLPLYYNDISTSTQDWSDEEFGAYMRLLIHQWRQGGLPNDYQRLTRIATSLDRNWPLLKSKFKEDDGLLKNGYMEDVRAKRAKHKEKQKENVSKRYQKSTKPPTKIIPLEEEIEKENEKEIKEEKEIEKNVDQDIDEKLSEALNPIYMDQEQMKWQHIDFEFEVRTFKNKVRGSPDHYRNHDTGGIRLALQSQLRYAKRKPKEINGNIGTGHINNLVEGHKRRYHKPS